MCDTGLQAPQSLFLSSQLRESFKIAYCAGENDPDIDRVLSKLGKVVVGSWVEDPHCFFISNESSFAFPSLLSPRS